MDTSETLKQTPHQITTPVVLIMFNRPELTRLTLAAIGRVKPSKLFVISDGPRASRDEDKDLVKECRGLLSLIDWPCEITKIFASSNMGCRDRIASGLTKVFESVDRAIVIEDDCLPNDSFFYFTQELLERYKDELSVGLISGTAFIDFSDQIPNSYFFSRHPKIWGWATWARVWKSYNSRISNWPELKETSLLRDNLRTRKGAATWRQNFNLVFWKRLDTWDYQLVLNLWRNNLLSVVPKANLVSNIGFGGEATHTLDPSSPFSALPTQEIEWPLDHPSTISANDQADLLSELRLFQRSWISRSQLALYFFFPKFLRQLIDRIHRGLTQKKFEIVNGK